MVTYWHAFNSGIGAKAEVTNPLDLAQSMGFRLGTYRVEKWGLYTRIKFLVWAGKAKVGTMHYYIWHN